MLTATSRLTALGQTAQLQATRDCDLLSAIETTIDALGIITAGLQETVKALKKAEASIDETPSMIDEEDKIIRLFDKSADAIATFHADLCKRRAAAVSDNKLQPEDGVVDAFDAAILTVADLHNTIMEVGWHIREHDADLDETADGSFADAKSLFASMGV